MGLQGKDIELILVKCLGQGLAHSSCLVNCSSYYLIDQQSLPTPVLLHHFHLLYCYPSPTSLGMLPNLLAGFATSVLHPAKAKGIFRNKKSD